MRPSVLQCAGACVRPLIGRRGRDQEHVVLLHWRCRACGAGAMEIGVVLAPIPHRQRQRHRTRVSRHQTPDSALSVSQGAQRAELQTDIKVLYSCTGFKSS